MAIGSRRRSMAQASISGGSIYQGTHANLKSKFHDFSRTKFIKIFHDHFL